MNARFDKPREWICSWALFERSVTLSQGEFTKSLTQSATRPGALKKFGAGLAGTALACFGLANKDGAATRQGYCQISGAFYTTDVWYTGMCMDINGCVSNASADCPALGTPACCVWHGLKANLKEACGSLFSSGKKCTFTI